MKCTDCNGSRFYVGLGFTQQQEACRHCGGTGIEPNSISKEKTVLKSDAGAGIQTAPRAKKYNTPQQLMLSDVEYISDNLGNFPTPIKEPGVSAAVYWIYVGRRNPPQCETDRRLSSTDSKSLPKAVALDYAQDHYLALYEREGTTEIFHCIWHY